MNGFKKELIHSLLFSIFLLVPCTAFSAEPGLEGFPPLPPDQTLQGEAPSQPEAPEEEFKRFPPPPRDPENIIKYRGHRAYTDNQPLKVSQISCERKAKDLVFVVIIFNQSVDPRSVHHDSFNVNNSPLPLGTRFTYNKMGNKVRLLVPVTTDSFKIKIQDIRSFDGSEIEPVEILAEVKR